MTRQATPKEPRFVLDDSLTEAELNAIVATTEAESIRLHEMIARTDALRAMAQHRLIGLQLIDAERE
jgi:hypothetical protein